MEWFLVVMKILVYKTVHEFSSTTQNRFRFPLKTKNYAFLAFTFSATSLGTSA